MGKLVDVSEVKTFMQITGTQSDVLLNLYIDITEAEIDAVVGRSLGRGTYTEVLKYLQSNFDHNAEGYLDAMGSAPAYFLKAYPIITMTLINGGTYTGYTLNNDNGVLQPNSQLFQPTATYVAGYNTQTAPADLKGVVMMGVSSLWDNNGAAGSSGGNKGKVASKRIKDFAVTYDRSQIDYYSKMGSQYVKNYIAANSAILTKYSRISL